MEKISKSVEETLAVAEAFAARLKGGDIVLLHGDLGAGKTTFTKGIARALGVEDVVTSPTFTIIKEYDGRSLRLYHMDMYRLDGDVTELGIEDYLGRKDGVCVIEWCSLEALEGKVYNVYLAYEGAARRIVIEE
ncbi:MAG: tRNA (adenosine(37)-N6)-threonylcarbamoyltransferase complex ATPase subunit type 1 TsaE [Clostridia bacterium]|nr:tRNA (adenosine(37)-N6)-threonylcarbamoyltransferase complex ATPase subunit type 1 TsaE [Clostridia bacterium]